MATIYFKESLVRTASTFINLKGTDDKLKAKADIEHLAAYSKRQGAVRISR